MTRQELVQQIFTKQTYLCIGLDTDKAKLPTHLQGNKDAIFEFNKTIIDATLPYCVGYKINTAFYEAEGLAGWDAMERTVNYIPATHFKIADAKRGDIGNTSAHYARAFFETMNFDAITVAPYMGEDSIRPFLEFKNKWTIVLGLTSNEGAKDFEMQQILRHQDNLVEGIHTTKNAAEFLYETVLKTVAEWGTAENLMFVIGATKAAEFERIRQLTPNQFYLVPGVGAQGGSLQEISKKAMINDCGLLVNASRAIIYGSAGEDFGEAAEKAAKNYAGEMKIYLQGRNPIL